MSNLLEISHVTFGYDSTLILDDFSMSLKQGEMSALIGPSGCGKTTLFKLITGMLQPRKGKITVADHGLPHSHRQVAYMMQEDLLLPWRSVLSNVTLTTELGSSKSRQALLLSEAIHLLHEVGLAGCEELYPHQLSGGMRQRVALARALLQKRPLLLLDEPFGSLDICLREHMYALLQHVHKKYDTTILIITHDFHDALFVADRILLFNRHEIHQTWTITPEIRSSPMENAILTEKLRAATVMESSEDLKAIATFSW